MREQLTSQMTFVQHLEDLRYCLIRALVGIFIMAILSFAWANELFSFLTAPLLASCDKVTLIGTGPAEAFIVKLKVSIAAGVIFSLPYSFLQLWNFISPGLHKHERKLALPFVLFSTFFFLIGVSFCYKAVMPYAFQFFMNEYKSIGTNPSIRIGEYLSFMIRLLLVFGVVFELPLLSLFLTRLGILTYSWLIHQTRLAIVIIFVCAAILTPPDVVTQIFLAGPLIVLYGLCIAVSYAFRKTNTV